MKTSTILFSGLGLGSIGITAGGSYLVAKSLSKEFVKFSGKLVFLRDENIQEKQNIQKIYSGNLLVDENYLENDEKCEIKDSSIFCEFSNLNSQEKGKLFLEKLGKQTSFDLLKGKLEELKNEFESSFGSNFYEKIISIFNDWNNKKFKGWLVFSIDEKNSSNPKQFIAKVNLSNDNTGASEDKKIFLKISDYVDKEKAEKYPENFNLTLNEGEDSNLSEKLKEYFETEDVKKIFKESFSDNIYSDLINLLKNNDSK